MTQPSALNSQHVTVAFRPPVTSCRSPILLLTVFLYRLLLHVLRCTFFCGDDTSFAVTPVRQSINDHERSSMQTVHTHRVAPALRLADRQIATKYYDITRYFSVVSMSRLYHGYTQLFTVAHYDESSKPAKRLLRELNRSTKNVKVEIEIS